MEIWIVSEKESAVGLVHWVARVCHYKHYKLRMSDSNEDEIESL